MKNRKFTRIALIGAAVLATSGLIFAQMRPRLMAFPHHGEKVLTFLSAYLDLTDEQEAAAKEVMKATRQANAPYLAQLKQIAEQGRGAIQAGKSDAELQQIANSAAPLVSEMIFNHMKAGRTLYAGLTPEQRQKAEELRSRIKERIAKRMMNLE